MFGRSFGEVPILGLIGGLLVCLKVSGVIDWGWAYVLMPFWLPIAILAFVLMIAFLIGTLSLLTIDAGNPKHGKKDRRG